ncbi:hypothetical protein GCM10027271_11340 [Saccharopolyspora gloriosae]|uniref:DUF6802 domain-containing protein n=1 Tax=Saccharopolyspora gloriosae TaxID=455344 RepID=A0A840NM99_9PSEU|nr:DUF6802 family protein [Saccharopolyspora gloriosae]MBB5072674.1 hypothetical protein [Saccharopolyspora gloriosae]
MYIEETGAGDGDIKVTVEGAEYTAEANYDLDGDGVDDAVTIMTDDGYVAYVDEDADGRADIMQTVDAEGAVVGQARYDAASGDWVAEQPQQHPVDDDPREQGGASMVIDTPGGEQQVGPATEDTDNDGRADTAVVTTETGTMLVTDVDGDGSADQLVEIGNTGEVTITHHTGAGQWTVVEQGRLDQQGQYTPAPHPVAGATDDATWTFDAPEPPQQDPRPLGAQAPQDVCSDSDAAWS